MRLAGRIATALLTLAFAVIAAFVWRVTRGPIPLDFLTPRIEAAVRDLDTSLRVSIGSTVLVWDAVEHDIDLRVLDVRLADSDGDGQQIAVPSIAVRPALAPLLRGRLEIDQIEVIGADLALVRQPDGALRLGLEGADAPPASLPELDALRRIPRLGLRDGNVRIDDRAAGRVWQATGVDVDLEPSAAGVHLQARADVDLAGLIAAGNAVLGLSFEGELTGDEDLLALSDLRATVGPLAVHAHGSVRGIDTGDFRLELEASSAGVDTAAVAGLWPPNVAPEARAWVTGNIRGGRARDVSARITAGRRNGSFAVESLAGTAAYDGLTVRFLDTMPPVTGVAGTVRFSLGGGEFEVARGRLLDIEVKGAKVLLPADRGPRIVIRADVRGPLTSAFTVLDSEPVGLAAALGFAPRAGTLEGRVGFAFPLRAGLEAGDLGLDVAATVRDAAVDHIAGDWALSKGGFEVRIERTALHLRGQGRLQDVPLRASLSERIDRRGDTRLEVDGTVPVADLQRLGFEVGERIGGAVGAHAVLTADSGGRQNLALDLDLKETEIDLGGASTDKSAGTPGSAAARVRLQAGEVVAVDDLRVAYAGNALTGSLTRGSGRWRTANLEIHLAGTDRSGVAVASLEVLPSSHFRLRSANAGPLLAVAGVAGTRGGRLSFDGTVDLERPGVPFSGNLEIDDIVVADSPLLTRLIAMASVRGLMAVVTREGTHFEQVRGELAYRDGVLTIRQGAARGSSFGLLADGTVVPAANTLDLQGSLVPSYFGLNQGLGDIPIIGRILTGDRGKGVQAIDFTARGSLDDPKVMVNPVSSLTPQMLQGLWSRLTGR